MEEIRDKGSCVPRLCRSTAKFLGLTFSILFAYILHLNCILLILFIMFLVR